jgi:hypothetical protein
MNALLLMDVSPGPIAGDSSVLMIMILLAVILVLSVTFLAALVFFLIRYKRRKLALAEQPEPTPGVEQFAHSK